MLGHTHTSISMFFPLLRCRIPIYLEYTENGCPVGNFCGTLITTFLHTQRKMLLLFHLWHYPDYRRLCYQDPSVCV